MITDDCENCQRLGSEYCKTCHVTQGVLRTHGSNYVQKLPLSRDHKTHSPFPGTDINVQDPTGRR